MSETALSSLLSALSDVDSGFGATVECPTHGMGAPAYLCGHLVHSPVQRWYGDWASAHDPRPGAWCQECHAAFLEEGEWNDLNGPRLGLRRVCPLCYDDLRDRSVMRLQGRAAAEWSDWLLACGQEMRQNQVEMTRAHALSHYQHYEWDDRTNTLRIIGDGRPTLLARMSLIGLYSTVTQHWAWAWSCGGLRDGVSHDVESVRNLGERMDWPHLTVARWKGTQQDAWAMCGVAMRVLGGEGIHRVSSEGTQSFLLLHSIRKA